MKKIASISTLCLLSSAILFSCVKQEFDTPPDVTKYDPGLTVTATLQNVVDNALSVPMDSSRVMGDSIITGVVVADDRSGNLYKKIIIQDTTGAGITVMIDKTYIYGDFPVGRRVYIKTKGLYLTNYRGTPEITYSVNPDGTTSSIPSSLLSKIIIKGSFPNVVKPAEITINDLYRNPQKYINTYIRISNMQFDNGSANVPYSSAAASTNRSITNCEHTAVLTMYNSSYSTFQPALTPNGNGTIDGIGSIYRSTVQFILRDTADVKFTGPRCP